MKRVLLAAILCVGLALNSLTGLAGPRELNIALTDNNREASEVRYSNYVVKVGRKTVLHREGYKIEVTAVRTNSISENGDFVGEPKRALEFFLSDGKTKLILNDYNSDGAGADDSLYLRHRFNGETLDLKLKYIPKRQP